MRKLVIVMMILLLTGCSKESETLPTLYDLSNDVVSVSIKAIPEEMINIKSLTVDKDRTGYMFYAHIELDEDNSFPFLTSGVYPNFQSYQTLYPIDFSFGQARFDNYWTTFKIELDMKMICEEYPDSAMCAEDYIDPCVFSSQYPCINTDKPFNFSGDYYIKSYHYEFYIPIEDLNSSDILLLDEVINSGISDTINVYWANEFSTNSIGYYTFQVEVTYEDRI